MSPRLDSRTSRSRGGVGRFRTAVVRATDTERAFEIRREASMIPQRTDELSEVLAGCAVGDSSDEEMLSGETDPFAFGKLARYSGLPTRNTNCCGGVALRTSSQNLSR